ncbi:MAG: GAF and ANTAR domain-containing protein [Actinobacteria bacterium]|nr:GAF and ANTAR domain-containing protein [Actinomycetota bacterium]
MEGGSEVQLAQTFAELARRLLAEDSVQATLDRIVEAAVDTIGGCDYAAVSLVEKRKISTAASTGDVPQQVDAIQYETDQGPCLDAIKDHEVLEVDDLMKEDRWPEFSKRAAEETSIRSMLSFRLFNEEDTVGALNLYAKDVGAFEEDAVAVGSVFAAHAAVALVGARKQEQLQGAIESRDTIGQAKGILMARQALTEAEAFDVLVRASQRTNAKLRDVAEQVAHTGDVPGP